MVKKGLTLVEVLVSAVVIGIAVTILMTVFSSYFRSAIGNERLFLSESFSKRFFEELMVQPTRDDMLDFISKYPTTFKTNIVEDGGTTISSFSTPPDSSYVVIEGSNGAMHEFEILVTLSQQDVTSALVGHLTDTPSILKVSLNMKSGVTDKTYTTYLPK